MIQNCFTHKIQYKLLIDLFLRISAFKCKKAKQSNLLNTKLILPSIQNHTSDPPLAH